MKVIESGRPEEAHPSEASPPYAQSEQLRFEVAGEAGSNQAESPQDNGAAPTQPAHPDHDRAPRIEPGSRGTAVGYIRVSTEDQTQGYPSMRNGIRSGATARTTDTSSLASTRTRASARTQTRFRGVLSSSGYSMTQSSVRSTSSSSTR